MAQEQDIRRFAGGGMDSDSAPEDVAPNDYLSAYNFRVSGTSAQQAGYGTNIESARILAGSLIPGINNIIGGEKFEDIGAIIAFRYNSGGYNQIVMYNYSTGAYVPIYTDLTDSANIPLLPLNPQNIVKCILINKTYLIWWAKDLEVGYTNLNTLASGGYGVVQAEDLSLLKPQCLIPPTGTYGSFAGQPANYWYSNLPVFNVQYVNADFNYSAWSTHSKRIVPYQEDTPIAGADVGQNNYIIIGVNIGSERASTINIGRQIGAETVFSIIKSVDRAYILALPHATVNVNTEVYEAYDNVNNIYYYASFGNEIPIPVDVTETDLTYDYIWPSNAGGLLNGNIAALGDFTTLYDRPNIQVSVNGGGYNPNINIPAGTYSDPLTMTNKFYGASGSGAGNHKRIMSFTLSGTPQTGDVVLVQDADIRNAISIHPYNYPVPSSQNGNLGAVAQSVAENLPNGSYVINLDGSYTITYIDAPYYGATVLAIELFFAGATVSNSIASVLDNTSYQAALSIRDKNGRFFPLDTDNTFIINTPSYAQVNGNAIEIQWAINSPAAPNGAYDYQWLITKPQVTKILDTIATPLNYLGGWDAKTNSPTLAVNTGTVGDTYQITTPDAPADTANYVNLGNQDTYQTGDYITYNGQSWNILPKSFGDLTGTGNILAFSLNSLKMLNASYEQEGVTTNLVYDFAQGDRCTLHYYLTGTTPTYINNPCVNLSVIGYDAGNYIVKVEKPNATGFDDTVLFGKNVFLRLYSPQLISQANSTTQQDLVWYEIGERFPIVNGQFSILNGVITNGGVYYKTRQFNDALQPYSNPPIQVLATDFNYSDFYPSAYNSFGRARTYKDELVKTERQASIIPSQNYVLGSQNNGLTRYYPSGIYGEGDGQTSSSQGSIQIMEQVGSTLYVLQELGIFRIPINIAWTALNETDTQESISSALLNNGRYADEGVGIGTAKESFWRRYNLMGFISPQKSEPYEITGGGIFSMSKKMSKFFKSTLQAAYAMGKKLFMFYNDYYEEPIMCIQSASGVLVAFPFAAPAWQVSDGYIIVPTDVTSAPDSTHAVASYNTGTGLLTYTPSVNYIGNDVGVVTFNAPIVGSVSKKACLTWIAGNGTPNVFSFEALFNQPLSTLLVSNSITVIGINMPVAITVTGGQYSVNGGAFTSSPGTVVNTDTVQVNNTSSASNSTMTTTTLTIGGVSANFNVTTIASGGTTNLHVYNNSLVDDITGITLTPSVGSPITFGAIFPGGSIATTIPVDTYSVLVDTTGSAARTCVINGTSATFSGSGYHGFTKTGVTTPIVITLT